MLKSSVTQRESDLSARYKGWYPESVRDAQNARLAQKKSEKLKRTLQDKFQIFYIFPKIWKVRLL